MQDAAPFLHRTKNLAEQQVNTIRISQSTTLPLPSRIGPVDEHLAHHHSLRLPVLAERLSGVTQNPACALPQLVVGHKT